MTLFGVDQRVVFETERVRVRRVKARRPYEPYFAVEQFFGSFPTGGSWTRLMDYELEREADALACAKYLDAGHSFADWRDMRKKQALPR